MSCQGKRSFDTEREARTELVGVLIARNRGNQRRKECRVYFCDYHQKWHLTSLPKWVEQDRAAG